MAILRWSWLLRGNLVVGGDMDTALAHLEAASGLLGGKPRIAGHRIKVQDVAIWRERLGLNA